MKKFFGVLSLEIILGGLLALPAMAGVCQGVVRCRGLVGTVCGSTVYSANCGGYSRAQCGVALPGGCSSACIISECTWACPSSSYTCSCDNGVASGQQGPETCVSTGCTTQHNPNALGCRANASCTPGAWVNGACGNTTNGCGYESILQTRSPACGGAGSQCVANLACPWPGVVQGQKVVVGTGSVPAASVTVDTTSSSTNPFSFSLTDTNAGGTHTASVPVNSSYDIGYTLCYNSAACHSGAITPGNSVNVADDSIRSNGANFANPYADLYWHYCPKLSAVQNITPNVSACISSGATMLTNVTWQAPVSGTPTGYTVVVIDNTTASTLVNATTVGTSQPVTITVGHSYTVTITANNACGGTSSASVATFSAVSSPTGAGTLTGTDLGGLTRLDWTNVTNGQRFRIYRDGVSIATVAPNIKTYTDAICGTHNFRVDAEDMTKPVGCQITAGSPINFSCSLFTSSWFSASGGGNLVAANGVLRSEVPAIVFNPYLTLPAVGLYPGMAVGATFQNVDSTNVNNKSWLFGITSPGWGGSGSNILSDRENSYDGMKDRIWSRIVPYEISPAVSNLNQAAFDAAYAVAPVLGSTGVKVMHWNNTGTLNIGNAGGLNLNGKKAVIFGEGNVAIISNISWSAANPGFLAVITKGNMSINSSVGTVGSTMDIDVRPWNIQADLMGIYYSGGVFSTGHDGAAPRDRILKIDGTVVGMGGVNLQRVNVGQYPVEFFNYQPGLVAQLSQIGLRRKIVQQLLNP